MIFDSCFGEFSAYNDGTKNSCVCTYISLQRFKLISFHAGILP